MRKAVLLASLGVALVAAAHASPQHEDFAYSPENRWVYDSLNKMMGKGILVGFRTFRPRGDAHQAQTRIVFAMATHAAYSKLRGMMGALQQRIAETRELADIHVLRAELDELREQVRGFGGYDEDIRDLIKLSRTFSKELQDLGVNILAMRRELSDLRERTPGCWRVRFAKDDPRIGVKCGPRL
jgi:hypothetical protein